MKFDSILLVASSMYFAKAVNAATTNAAASPPSLRGGQRDLTGPEQCEGDLVHTECKPSFAKTCENHDDGEWNTPSCSGGCVCPSGTVLLASDSTDCVAVEECPGHGQHGGETVPPEEEP